MPDVFESDLTRNSYDPDGIFGPQLDDSWDPDIDDGPE